MKYFQELVYCEVCCWPHFFWDIVNLFITTTYFIIYVSKSPPLRPLAVYLWHKDSVSIPMVTYFFYSYLCSTQISLLELSCFVSLHFHLCWANVLVNIPWQRKSKLYCWGTGITWTTVIEICALRNHAKGAGFDHIYTHTYTLIFKCGKSEESFSLGKEGMKWDVGRFKSI